MKKILLTAAAVATLATSTAYAAEDIFYVKGQVGWDKLNKVSGAKSKSDVFAGVGVGYYVMDNLRADLTFDHYFNPEHKITRKNVTTKAKSNANTLMVNGFVDLFDVSVAKVFAGAGVGISMVSGKVNTPAHTDTNGNAQAANSYKHKKKNNFAYALHLGASTEFAPGVNGELTYSFRDVGKAKGGAKLKGHHVAVGVRFDI